MRSSIARLRDMQILLLVVNLCLVAYMIWFASTVFSMRTVPPLVKTRRAVATRVVSVLGPLPAGSVFYELGAGDGRVVSAVAAANPRVRCIGVERYYLPYFLCRTRQFFERLPNVSYIRADIFSADLRSATHLYAYMYPGVMEKLAPKLEKELKPGARFLALDFPFPGRLPEHVEDVSDGSELGKKLYLYSF